MRSMNRYETRPIALDDVPAAANLLAARHARQRAAWPALDPAYEDRANCETLIEQRLASDGAIGAIAFANGEARGYVVMTQRPETWGANAWAEDDGNAGDREAIRECYAAVAGEIVDAGRRGHWAVVPATEIGTMEAWFSLSFGLQQVYAHREPVGAEFLPQTPDRLLIRRAETRDIHTLAQLDLILPQHTQGAPVFSTLPPPNLDAAEAEVAQDIDNPKFAFFLAEYEGRVISTLVGCSVTESSSWSSLMRPQNTALLGYAATFPDARGLGAGRALTETFMAWARDEGFSSLAVDWRSTNLEANRTWRAMGFRPGYYRLNRHIP